MNEQFVVCVGMNIQRYLHKYFVLLQIYKRRVSSEKFTLNLCKLIKSVI